MHTFQQTTSDAGKYTKNISQSSFLDDNSDNLVSSLSQTFHDIYSDFFAENPSWKSWSSKAPWSLRNM